MSEFRKAKDDKLYFVTLTVVGWVDLFTRPCYREIVIDNHAPAFYGFCKSCRK